ncbi:hypothetical protein K438DRAFT_1768161 [Mycena galopus ATCC 62051]|nr:hypothetical protein K438DRAFT_1768161 [Mycena galopus ATCC 62051]
MYMESDRPPELWIRMMELGGGFLSGYDGIKFRVTFAPFKCVMHIQYSNPSALESNLVGLGGLDLEIRISEFQRIQSPIHLRDMIIMVGITSLVFAFCLGSKLACLWSKAVDGQQFIDKRSPIYFLPNEHWKKLDSVNVPCGEDAVPTDLLSLKWSRIISDKLNGMWTRIETRFKYESYLGRRRTGPKRHRAKKVYLKGWENEVEPNEGRSLISLRGETTYLKPMSFLATCLERDESSAKIAEWTYLFRVERP